MMLKMVPVVVQTSRPRYSQSPVVEPTEAGLSLGH